MLDEIDKPAAEGSDSILKQNETDKARFDELATRISSKNKRPLYVIVATSIPLFATIILIIAFLLYNHEETSSILRNYFIAGIIVILFIGISYMILTYLRPQAGGDDRISLRSAGTGAVAYAAHGNITMGYSAEQVSEIIKQIAPESQQLVIATQRLSQEISALGRRGNINLLIGIMTTIAGVSVLAFVVFGEVAADPDQTLRYVMHFVLRLSIALFIETFAYFFLRMYRNNLDDIKYYQNEITNLETKWWALSAASKAGDKAVLKSVIDTLVKTERNFILKKGESVYTLERDRMDKNEIADLVRIAIGKVSPLAGKNRVTE